MYKSWHTDQKFFEKKIPDLCVSFFMPFIFLILLSPVNYVTMKFGETVRRGRKGSEYYV